MYRSTVFLIVCISLTLSANSLPQQTSLQVQDSTGAVIVGATVELRGASTVKTFRTDSSGRVRFECQVGSKAVVSSLGFQEKSLSLTDCKASLTVTLTPAAVNTTMNVVVRDEGVRIEGAPTAVTSTAAEIDRTTARTAFDAVDELSPSVYVTRRGVMGYGISTNGTGAVNIHGIGDSPNTDVLIVLNGRPDYQGEMGHPLPDFYDLSEVGSISVIEGPASVLYGTNAMAGAIEITPRVPDGNREFRLTSSLGSYETGQHRLWAGLRQGKAVYSFAANVNHTDGDRPDSGFHSQNLSSGVGYTLSKAWKLGFDGNYGHFLVHDPGPVTAPLTNSYASVGRGGFSMDLANSTDQLNGYTRFYSTWGHNFISDGFRSVDRITGGRVSQTWTLRHHAAIDFGSDIVNYGGTARQLGASPTNYGGDHQITDAAGFFRAHWNPITKLLFNAGVRYQTNTQFGNLAVPEFGAIWTVVPRLTWSGSISEGFRNPTLRELYLFPAPNPNLKPEKLWNYQATLKLRITNQVSGWTTFYYANVKDQIVTLGNYPNLQLLNIGNAINKGVDVNIRWAIRHKVSVSGGYAFLTSTNIAPLVPQNKAILATDFNLKRAFVHLGVQAIGRRYTDTTLTTQMGGYTFASAKISFPFQRHYDIFATVDNILNRQYMVLPGYPMPGVNAAGGVSIHY